MWDIYIEETDQQNWLVFSQWKNEKCKKDLECYKDCIVIEYYGQHAENM